MDMNTINPDAQLQLVSVRLSAKADAQLVDDKDGINGKLNLTSDGRKYYIAVFRDPSNPFGAERTRIIAQTTDSEDNPVWKSGNPALIKQFVGKNIPGDIVTKSVVPYDVDGREVMSYTSVVLKGETITSVFKSQGHQLMTSDGIIKDESAFEEESDFATNDNATETAPSDEVFGN